MSTIALTADTFAKDIGHATPFMSIQEPDDKVSDELVDGRRMAKRFITGIDGAAGFVVGSQLSQVLAPAEQLAEALGVNCQGLHVFAATINGMAHTMYQSAVHHEPIDLIKVVVALNIHETFCENEVNWIHDYHRFPYCDYERAPVTGSTLIRIGMDLSMLHRGSPAIPGLGSYLKAGFPRSRRGEVGPVPLSDSVLAHAVRFVESIQYWTGRRCEDRLARRGHPNSSLRRI